MYVDLYKAIEDYAALNISGKNFYALMHENPSFFIKNRSKISAAETLRQRTVKERSLEVVYVTGKSEAGKTTFAKYLSAKFNYDCFITGSGDDPFDGYDKEECINIDEFRDGTMRFSELLKLLDNNTNSSVRSRYNNKDISNCKLMVITTIFKPQQLYSKMMSEHAENEPAVQLYRRLGYRYWIIEGEPFKGDIKEVKLNKDGTESRTGRILGNMADVFYELGIDPKAEKKTSILDPFIKTPLSPLEEITDPAENELIDQIFNT